MACGSETCDFKPMAMQRRPLGENDVLIRMVACGICHSDLHVARRHLESVAGKVQYPLVPGHELGGIVTAVGPKVRVVVGAATASSIAVMPRIPSLRPVPLFLHYWHPPHEGDQVRSGRPRGRGMHGGLVPELHGVQARRGAEVLGRQHCHVQRQGQVRACRNLPSWRRHRGRLLHGSRKRNVNSMFGFLFFRPALPSCILYGPNLSVRPPETLPQVCDERFAIKIPTDYPLGRFQSSCVVTTSCLSTFLFFFLSLN